MVYDECFFRRNQSSQFFKINTPVFVEEFPCTFVSDDMVYCTVHSKWEKILNRGGSRVLSLCGYTQEGEIYSLKPEGNTDIRQTSCYKSFPLNAWAKVNIVNKTLSSIPAFFAYKSDFKYINPLHTEEEEDRQPLLYNNTSSEEKRSEVFAFIIRTDDEKYTVHINIYSIKNCSDKGSFPYERSEYKYSVKEGTVKIRGREISDLPDFLVQKAAEEIVSLTAKLTGVHASVNTALKGAEKLEALVNYPFECNLYPLVRMLDRAFMSFIDIKSLRNNPDCYNIVLKTLGVPPLRTIRKSFYNNPFSPFIYKKLTQSCLYKDINIINGLMAEEALNLLCLQYVCEDMIFFLKKVKEERSEKKALNCIRKSRSSVYINDCLSMFQSYFEHIPGDVKEEIYRRGFTEYNHNVLSRISYEAQNENTVFDYTESEKKLQCEISGYKFLLPKDSYTLQSIGASLHNCVAGYKNSILNRRCLIVYAVKDETIRLCIEVRGRAIHQQRADYNKSPQGNDLAVMTLYRQLNDLSFSGNKW